MEAYKEAQSGSAFFKLPAEVRNRIYGYSFDEEIVQLERLLERRVATSYPRCWSIVVSCKLAYTESRALFYILALFDCNGNVNALEFLRHVPPSAKQYIQHVFGVRPKSVYALRELISRLPNIKTVGSYAGAMELSASETQVFVRHNNLNYATIYNFIMADAPEMNIVTEVRQWIHTVTFLVSSDVRLNLPDIDAGKRRGRGHGHNRSLSAAEAQVETSILRRHNIDIRDFVPMTARYRIVRMMICFDLTRHKHLIRARTNVIPGQQEIDIDLW